MQIVFMLLKKIICAERIKYVNEYFYGYRANILDSNTKRTLRNGAYLFPTE
jgi:hypothetical protein